MKCNECKREFQDHLLAPLIVGDRQVNPCCPLCALRLRNKIHGLPADTPFQGEQAHAMWEEAKHADE